MNGIQGPLSVDKKRDRTYRSFLEICRNGHITVRDMAHLGYRVMKKNKLHPHFFGEHSLLNTALYLSFFTLKFPYEYDNPKYLDRKITMIEARKIIELFEKRIADRLPVEYITNEAYYLGHKFYVNENVLVPRSLMNTRFKDFLNEVQWENYRVLDLCTGSGCIGISLALLNSKINVDLADISTKALEVAEANIKHHALNDRVRCIQSDLFTNIQGKYDLIISNPPYVPLHEYEAQAAELKKEPAIALVAGKDGLEIIDKILRQTKQHLNPNGLLIAEVGYTPAKHLKRKYPNIPFKWLKYRQPSGKESLLDKIIKYTGYLDSIFVLRNIPSA